MVQNEDKLRKHPKLQPQQNNRSAGGGDSTGNKDATANNKKNERAQAAPLAGRVSTKPNTAFFWSGRSENANGQKIGGAAKASEIAKKNGGTTLETLIEERKIKMPDWDPNNPTAIKAWEKISNEYASGASGEVRAVIGKELRPGNIWETKELPALLKNPNVTKIVTIDPATGLATVIFP